MQEHSYFQKALADFTQEAASGGAIRHLADMGYTVKQIMERLDFPTPYERVQKAVWERNPEAEARFHGREIFRRRTGFRGKKPSMCGSMTGMERPASGGCRKRRRKKS